MKLKSINSKLIVYIVALVILVTGLCAGVGYYVSSSAITHEVDNGLLGLAKESAKHLDSELEIAKTFLRAQAQRRFVTDSNMSRSDKIKLYQEAAETGNLLQFVVADINGDAFLSTGDEVNIADRAYFKRSLKGEEAVSDVIIHKLTGEPVITISAPIVQENKVIGVLVGVKDATFLTDVVTAIEFGETGYAYAINKTGTVMAHVNSQLVLDAFNPIEEAKDDATLTELADMMKNRMITGQTGVGSYTFRGKRIRNSFAPLENAEWSFAVAMEEEEALAGLTTLLRSMSLIGLTAIALGIGIAFFLSKSIAKPISLVTDVIEKIADYDLRFKENHGAVAYIDREDEIGVMTNALAKMEANFRDLIKNTANATEQVAASSEELMATGEELSTTSEEVGRTVEEIAAGSSSQARDTEVGALQANDLGDIIATNVEQIDQLSQSSDEITTLKDEGIHIVKELVAKTTSSSEAAKEISTVIDETNKSASDIGKASNMIKSIADQTNLLALNAAIEAARAGDAGKGFAVVADEIRDLAEQSNKFADEISQTIETLTKQTNYAVRRMTEIGKIVASQTESVNMTNEKFEGIAQAIEQTALIVKELSTSGLQMNEKREEINKILENLSAVSEENAAGTQEASAAMEEQIASIQEMTRASEQLARLAEEVQANIAKFKY